MATNRPTKKHKPVARRPTTDRVLTPATQARLAAMNAQSPIVTQEEITNVLHEYETEISRASVGHVIHGRFWNARVARVFCDLTGTDLWTMWPEFKSQQQATMADDQQEKTRWARAGREARAAGPLRP